MMGSETNDIIDELFNSLLQRYKKASEESRKTGSEFVFNNADALYYKLKKKSLKRGWS